MHSRGLRLSLHIGRLHVGNRALVQKLKRWRMEGCWRGREEAENFVKSCEKLSSPVIS
jgi:undecaprenyl pyrophosphate synthase